MDAKIANIILVPVCIIAIFFVVRFLLLRLKKWRTRRVIERGIIDLVYRVRGRETRSKTDQKKGAINNRSPLSLRERTPNPKQVDVKAPKDDSLKS